MGTVFQGEGEGLGRLSWPPSGSGGLGRIHPNLGGQSSSGGGMGVRGGEERLEGREGAREGGREEKEIEVWYFHNSFSQKKNRISG